MKSSFVALLGLGAATLIAPAALAQTPTAESLIDNPTVNVRQSQNYSSLVDRDAAFRAQRVRQECDPIESPDLRRQCIDSFGATASSGASDGRTMRSGVGRGTR
ncbi:MAG: hypothetical protein HY060_16695 [Proteobacteria bacterium]|nr:hypothetical protein [Pseudomonadota bacterium]